MKLTKMSTRYLVLPQVFGIDNAFAAPAWFQFYSNAGCRQNVTEIGSIQMEEDYLSQACALLYYNGMHNTSRLAI
jgi:hypothetical protein